MGERILHVEKAYELLTEFSSRWEEYRLPFLSAFDDQLEIALAVLRRLVEAARAGGESCDVCGYGVIRKGVCVLCYSTSSSEPKIQAFSLARFSGPAKNVLRE